MLGFACPTSWFLKYSQSDFTDNWEDERGKLGCLNQWVGPWGSERAPGWIASSSLTGTVHHALAAGQDGGFLQTWSLTVPIWMCLLVWLYCWKPAYENLGDAPFSWEKENFVSFLFHSQVWSYEIWSTNSEANSHLLWGHFTGDSKSHWHTFQSCAPHKCLRFIYCKWMAHVLSAEN